MSEYYFKYETAFCPNDLGLDTNEMPRLYIERDYKNKSLEYGMYMVFPDLYAYKVANRGVDAKYPFDNIRVLFDRSGVEMNIFDPKILNAENDVIYDVNGKAIEVNRKTTVAEYIAAGYRLDIGSFFDDLSGVGAIVLESSSRPHLRTVVYFYVNFAFKRKLLYSITGGKLTVEAGRDVCRSVPIAIVYHGTRFPCLADDFVEANVIRTSLEFGNGKKAVLQLPGDIVSGDKVHITVDPESELADHYIIECMNNDTLDLSRGKNPRPVVTPFCPYCNRPLKTMGSAYGDCRGKKSGDVFVKDGVPMKSVRYCERDDIENYAGTDFARVLPKDYENRDNFKIVLAGAQESGKSAFLSRMLNVARDKRTVTVFTDFLENVFSNMGGKNGICDVTAYSVNSTERNTDGIAVRIKPWMDGNFADGYYSRYVPEDTDDCKYFENISAPNKAVYADTGRFPFVLDVDNRHYVSLYDTVGKQLERDPDKISALISNGACGIFYFIDGDAIFDIEKRAAAHSVSEKAEALLADFTGPIAVVVSKFEKVKNKFFDNCHCVRTDEFEMINDRYEDSAMSRNVDLASAEIEALLGEFDLDPIIERNKNTSVVKYFGVSGFSCDESFTHDRSGAEDKLKFMSDPYRAELPLLWMFKMFGIII